MYNNPKIGVVMAPMTFVLQGLPQQEILRVNLLFGRGGPLSSLSQAIQSRLNAKLPEAEQLANVKRNIHRWIKLSLPKDEPYNSISEQDSRIGSFFRIALNHAIYERVVFAIQSHESDLSKLPLPFAGILGEKAQEQLLQWECGILKKWEENPSLALKIEEDGCMHLDEIIEEIEKSLVATC